MTNEQINEILEQTKKLITLKDDLKKNVEKLSICKKKYLEEMPHIKQEIFCSC